MTALNTELKQQLDDTIAQFLDNEYDFPARQSLVASEEGYSREHWRAFAELGWLGIPFAEQHGGIGGAFTDTLEMMRLFGKHLVVEPFASTVGMVGGAIAQGSNRHLKEECLSRLIAGEVIGALAMEEPGSRGNPALVNMTAQPLAKGGEYRLRGEKICVLNAPQADFLLVSARTSEEQSDTDGISLFLVETDREGVQLTSYPTVDGHRAANIKFDVELGLENMLSEEGQGYPLLIQAVDNGLLMLCAEAVGIMEALLDTTVEYTNTRKQFGVPLSTFQVLRHRMADMFIEYQRTSALLDTVVLSQSAGGSVDRRSLHLLKAQVGHSGRLVGDAAIQLHGGMGMTDELIVGHYVKRLIAIGQLLGNVNFHLQQAWRS
ncbi:pimeloyl-CoA dehydrogenase small subunit [Spongiibacter sp. KMU-166]|uniref:Pimeloyl-CoA dehydrogenase small subunit n=1 Tax=Spongiibacter thalassae TaxID=2721624 RepID=A0ABX1GBN2_9GAMM|nr:acyl-CoA dehydrogenase family protein [Spongiibacter thalassae]NKI15907.1 pimeloyl-CoA dehydrogenase small subunit [Spongiibacter thalassae]